MFETSFKINKENNSLIIEREFSASTDRIWEAWTNSTILDQWWVPKPWKLETQYFSFTEGGKWFYNITGPNEEKRWALLEYEAIHHKENFSALDTFCDEHCNKIQPSTHILNEFTEANDITLVKSTSTFHDTKSMNQLLELGLQEAVSMTYRNLDELIAELVV